MSLAIIALSFLLFTAGMACFGLVFLSFLQESLERAELIDGYK